jgi:cellulose synthase/poly-beta-1,6-N-acetylglucosamine synthase-like glycosyltransferase
VIAVEIVFWACVALIAYTHLGYPLTLFALTRLGARGGQPWSRGDGDATAGSVDAGAAPDPLVALSGRAGAEQMPVVSLIVAAYDEEEVIASKVADALALDYPRERLEVIVASDGSGDATV